MSLIYIHIYIYFETIYNLAFVVYVYISIRVQLYSAVYKIYTHVFGMYVHV